MVLNVALFLSLTFMLWFVSLLLCFARIASSCLLLSCTWFTKTFMHIKLWHKYAPQNSTVLEQTIQIQSQLKHTLHTDGRASPSHAWLVGCFACRGPGAIITAKWSKAHGLLNDLHLLKNLSSAPITDSADNAQSIVEFNVLHLTLSIRYRCTHSVTIFMRKVNDWALLMAKAHCEIEQWEQSRIL